MSAIFGGSKQNSSSTASSSSVSGNKSYDQLNQAFSPMFGNATSGASALSALLNGDASGFNAFKNATGFDAASEMGSRGITGNAAASGLLRSGSTAKALQSFGDTIQNQYANNYMSNLFNKANLGFQAGNLVSGAGQFSQSQSQSQGTSSGSSKPGIGKFLGTIAAGAAASDRRLKKNIFKIGKLSNGLSLYQYRYINDAGPFIGVMADEVEKIMPEALGPIIDGYKTVDYDMIKGATN